jgi:nodulation protein E
MRRRVIVSGMGVVSAIGSGCDAFAASLRAGRPGIAPLGDAWPEPLRGRPAAAVRDVDLDAHFSKRDSLTLDRFAQLGVVAAREAVAAAGESIVREAGDRGCVITGSCVGGQITVDDVFHRLYRAGEAGVSPFSVPRTMANGAASRISMEFGLRGPAYAVASACSSANHAIGQAFWLIRDGVADLAVAGGSEAPIAFGHLKAWDALRVMAGDTCRPFCGTRAGTILGEGAAMLVLEPLDAALARGARIFGEIRGFGMTADANHLTQPTSDGGARAMRAAIADAGLQPEHVDYINAHGTGTKTGDPCEIAAIREVFGPHATRLAISSTKSMHGHTLGAAGAIEGAATLIALREGFVPPTINYAQADPACDLDVVPNTSRAAPLSVALSNSFGFGGLNAMLVFARWDATAAA